MSILGNNLLAQYYAQNQGLPFGYERVEYLESTGTQYIDTNYAFEDDFTWEIDFDGIQNEKVIFGGRSNNVRTSILYNSFYNILYINIAGHSSTTSPFNFSTISTRCKIKVHVNNNTLSAWKDGVLNYNNQSFTGDYISGVTQVIFADNFGDSVSEFTASKLYSLKMWQGNILVRNFSPCILKSDGKPGLYDLCRSICPLTGNSFYINAGTGEFVTP